MTLVASTSDPVPAEVVMAIQGRGFSVGIFLPPAGEFAKSQRLSVGCGISMAMALEASMTEPPPRAMTKSTPFSRPTFAPSSTACTSGFAAM